MIGLENSSMNSHGSVPEVRVTVHQDWNEAPTTDNDTDNRQAPAIYGNTDTNDDITDHDGNSIHDIVSKSNESIPTLEADINRYIYCQFFVF